MNNQFTDNLEKIKVKNWENYSIINDFLKKEHFFIFLLTKKMVGKSVYSSYLINLFPEKISAISFGQTIRDLQTKIETRDPQIKKDFTEKEIEDIQNSSVKNLVPLTTSAKIFEYLIKNRPAGKSILFDGFPRSSDQIDLTIKTVQKIERENNMRVLFLEIDLADDILNQRMESRRICPQCNLTDSILTPSNAEIIYVKENQTFELQCPQCHQPMTRKKGDQLSPAVEERREKFKEMMQNLKMKMNKPEKFISFRTDIFRKEFEGELEELNQTISLSFNQGKIKKEFQPQTGTRKGETIYSMGPNMVVGIILQKLAEKIKSN